MTQPNPFSMANSLEHLVNPKIVTGLSGTQPIYQVGVDIANVDTFYGRQLGGSTLTQEIQQAYIHQIGTTFLPTSQAYINQIGSSGSSGQAYFNLIGNTGSAGDAHFNKIFWNSFDPPLPTGGGGGTFIAGPGISSITVGGGQLVSSIINAGAGISINTPANGQPYVISAIPTLVPIIQGSTGIGVTFSGTTYTISSILGITGSTGIGVQQNGNTYTISYTGTQGGTAISGVSGSYAVFDSSGIQSSTVLTSSNIVGSTGQVMLYSFKGPTGSSLLNLDITGRTLNTPTIIINDPIAYPNNTGKYLRLTNDSSASYIQSGSVLSPSSSAPLVISGMYGGPLLTTFDIPNGKVTVNPSANQPNPPYPSGISTLVASQFSGETFINLPSGTYNIYAWGGGGAGLSGYPGGAGSLQGLTNVTTGATGITFRIYNQGLTGVQGGGDALGVDINNSLAFIAAGGGAGGTAGAGVSSGQVGGSYPGQGYSFDGFTGLGGIYSSNLNQPTYYTLGSTGITAASGGIFSNVPVIFGLTGIIAPNSIIRGYGTILQNTSGSTASYYFPPGSTMTILTSGMTFFNSSYTLSGITGGTFNTFIASGLTGTSGTFRNFPVGGTATSNTGVTGTQFLGSFVGISGTSFSNGNGIGVLLDQETFSIPSGVTLSLPVGITFSDFNINGGIQINFQGIDTFAFSTSLGGQICPKLGISQPVFIPPTSTIQVASISATINGSASKNMIDPITGITGTGIYGAGGGGGSFFSGITYYGGGGGGGIAGGGGGAGRSLNIYGIYSPPGVTIGGGIIQNGSGTSPASYRNNFNGNYGFGGSGTVGGSSYYVIEKVVSGTQPDVLQVNGNTNITGVLTVGSTGGNSINAYGRILGQAISTVNPSSGFGFTTLNNGIEEAAFFPKGIYSGITRSTLNLIADTSGNLNMNGQLRVGPTAPAGLTGDIIASGAISGASVYATTTISGQDVTARSDIRLKENIQTIDSALEKVMKLRGVYFSRKDSEKRNIGVIAQEIEEIIPEVVFTDESSEQIKSVAYGNIVGLLIEALKEQQEEIKQLKQFI